MGKLSRNVGALVVLLAGTSSAQLTQRASVDSSGTEGDDDSYFSAVSADGRYVAFYGYATNFDTGDTNGALDVFVRDRQSGTTERVSLDSGGVQANDDSFIPSISADGRFVTYHSSATNLVPGDTNGASDIFVHDCDATSFTSLCDPGLRGVIACPCSNPPSAAGRGCDNSSATGGAVLSASGIAYLSQDELVFTTSGESPAAASILLQGNGSVAAGLVFGRGVRCVGGTILRRLFTKSASGGSITVPDFLAGDPTVSERSEEKGDVIQPGQSRWYLVFYRDPVVSAGCPSTSTFNATQTGKVEWSL